MTTTIHTIKDFLAAEVEILSRMNAPSHLGGYRSLGDFILKSGRSFAPSSLPSEVKRGRMKECYKNCASAVLFDHAPFTYCEGYAVGVIPVMHAWLCDVDGNAIDPTWKDGVEYFGVAINATYLRRTIMKNKVYGVIDNWQKQWPILTDDPKLWRHPIMDTLKTEP